MLQGIKHTHVMYKGFAYGGITGLAISYLINQSFVGFGIGIGTGALLSYIYLCIKYGRKNLNVE